MRIAFVGKGGSGKTTLSALFSLYLESKDIPLLVADADINIHMPELFGMLPFDPELHISHPTASKYIKEHLRGATLGLENLAAFRKTTPPTRTSNLVSLDPSDPIIKRYAQCTGSIPLLVVGTYDTDDIGASCYHNNLSILENILSHMDDKDGIVVADMVAGIDAFANTLHAQFDMIVLVVEPTKRSIEVYNQYRALAETAGIAEHLLVVANKVKTVADHEFIKIHVPQEALLGCLCHSPYLHTKEQQGGALELTMLEPENKTVLETIYKKLSSLTYAPNDRLQKLWTLHRTYVAQDFIKERFGDLISQIDESFQFDA